MRKFTFLKMMLLAVVMLAGSMGSLLAQGTEDFEAQTTLTASYATNSFTNATSGITWSYANARNEETYGITGKGIMLRYADSYLEATLSSGFGKISFQYRKAFTGASVRQLELLVNGVSVKTDPSFGTGTETTVYDFVYEVNTSGPATIRIKNVGTGTTNKQIVVDNIVWTAYSGGGNPTVATPTFSPGTGTYTTAQNVTISTLTEGATIRYTTNGDEPTETSTEYTSPIDVSSTTTIKAKAFKVGMDASAVASATYSFPVQVANIAGFLATSETGNVAISGSVTVVYQKGLNLYVKDASGTLLVYGSTGKTFVNGDQLTGLMGIRGEYGLSPQMTNPVAPDAVSGTAVNPTTYDLAAVSTADHAKYVKVENVQFVADVAYSTTSTVNGTLVAPAGFIVRDNFRLGGTFTAVKSYDIVGFINYYNGTAQLYPVTITEFVDPSTGLTSTRTDAKARAYNGKVLFNATAGESVEIYNTVGQKLVSTTAVDGLNEVPVRATGVLVVKVSNRVSKVIL